MTMQPAFSNWTRNETDSQRKAILDTADRLLAGLPQHGMSPAELLAAGRAEVTGYGVEIIEDAFDAIDDEFTVRLAGGDILMPSGSSRPPGSPTPSRPARRPRTLGPRRAALSVLPRVEGP
jgi:hypothetical protein